MRLLRKIKRKWLNKITRKLFNTITANDVLVYNKTTKTFLIGDREITHKHMLQFKKDAEIMKELPLWELLSNDLKHIANKQMFEKSTCDDDMIFGKAMLYNLDIIEKKINNLARLK